MTSVNRPDTHINYRPYQLSNFSKSLPLPTKRHSVHIHSIGNTNLINPYLLFFFTTIVVLVSFVIWFYYTRLYNMSFLLTFVNDVQLLTNYTYLYQFLKDISKISLRVLSLLLFTTKLAKFLRTPFELNINICLVSITDAWSKRGAYL